MLQSILVKGEVSNCKYHSSGHIYFTLKDERGAIPCVMFAGNRGGLGFRLQDGQRVIAGGSIDVYEKEGRYQMYARQIAADGAGMWHERFERLKAQLAERGMFAPEYKRPIPRYIGSLGVVTAPTGAAVRDIIHVAKRRNPYIRIILYPAIVQGEAAPQSIVDGIRAMEKQDVDVIIVGRGGGSIEDLWAFNEEIVAQAVFDCPIPVISAVGHETDTTIVDFVSDLRAPTPSAAAELAVYDYRILCQALQEYGRKLDRQMMRGIGLARRQAEQCAGRLRILSPAGKIREKRTFCLRMEERLQENMQKKLRQDRHRMEVYIERMKGLSPLDKLSRGFSYVSDEAGKNVKSVSQVRVGDRLQIRVTDGCIRARVSGREEDNEARGKLC